MDIHGNNDENNGSAIAELRQRATSWVDRFWSSATVMSTLQLMLTCAFEINGTEFDDSKPINSDFPRTFDGLTLVKLRAQRHNVQITERAAQFISLFVHVPGDVSMYMAAIVHVFRAIDIDETNLITYEWVHSLFEGKCLDREELGRQWQNQYMSNGANLVDVAMAFDIGTDDYYIDTDTGDLYGNFR